MVGAQLAVHSVVTCRVLALSVVCRLCHCLCQLYFLCSAVVHVGFCTGTASVPSVCLNEDTQLVHTSSSVHVQCTLLVHSVHLSVLSSLFSLHTHSDGRASSVTLAWSMLWSLCRLRETGRCRGMSPLWLTKIPYFLLLQDRIDFQKAVLIAT